MYVMNEGMIDSAIFVVTTTAHITTSPTKSSELFFQIFAKANPRDSEYSFDIQFVHLWSVSSKSSVK